MTSDDWEMLAEAELTHDKSLAAHEVSLLTPAERSLPMTWPYTEGHLPAIDECTCLGTLIPSACPTHNPW
jgi:hypothetical protein